MPITDATFQRNCDSNISHGRLKFQLISLVQCSKCAIGGGSSLLLLNLRKVLVELDNVRFLQRFSLLGTDRMQWDGQAEEDDGNQSRSGEQR